MLYKVLYRWHWIVQSHIPENINDVQHFWESRFTVQNNWFYSLGPGSSMLIVLDTNCLINSYCLWLIIQMTLTLHCIKLQKHYSLIFTSHMQSCCCTKEMTYDMFSLLLLTLLLVSRVSIYFVFDIANFKLENGTTYDSFRISAVNSNELLTWMANYLNKIYILTHVNRLF